MSEALLGSIIVAVLGMVGNIIIAKSSADKNMAIMETKFDDYTKNTNEKIDDLKKQVEKHNKIVERTYALEGRMNEAEHDIRDLKAKEK